MCTYSGDDCMFSLLQPNEYITVISFVQDQTLNSIYYGLGNKKWS